MFGDTSSEDEEAPWRERRAGPRKYDLTTGSDTNSPFAHPGVLSLPGPGAIMAMTTAVCSAFSSLMYFYVGVKTYGTAAAVADTITMEAQRVADALSEEIFW